jgi:exodeoxyribonuclease VII small subunit
VSEEIGYAEAMAELEEILGELEGDHLDVDVLADRVRRASELIKLCRTRIGRAQADVDRIVTDLEAFERELDGDEGAEEEGDDGELF